MNNGESRITPRDIESLSAEIPKIPEGNPTFEASEHDLSKLGNRAINSPEPVITSASDDGLIPQPNTPFDITDMPSDTPISPDVIPKNEIENLNSDKERIEFAKEKSRELSNNPAELMNIVNEMRHSPGEKAAWLSLGW